MKFSFEFLDSFGPAHTRKIETEVILAAFNNIYITGAQFTKYLTIYRKIIESLSYDRLTIVT